MESFLLIISSLLALVGIVISFIFSGYNYNEQWLNIGITFTCFGLFIVFLLFVYNMGKSSKDE